MKMCPHGSPQCFCQSHVNLGKKSSLEGENNLIGFYVSTREATGRKDAGQYVYLLKSPSFWKVSADYGTMKGISYAWT